MNNTTFTHSTFDKALLAQYWDAYCNAEIRKNYTKWIHDQTPFNLMPNKFASPMPVKMYLNGRAETWMQEVGKEYITKLVSNNTNYWDSIKQKYVSPCLDITKNSIDEEIYHKLNSFINVTNILPTQFTRFQDQADRLHITHGIRTTILGLLSPGIIYRLNKHTEVFMSLLNELPERCYSESVAQFNEWESLFKKTILNLQ